MYLEADFSIDFWKIFGSLNASNHIELITLESTIEQNGNPGMGQVIISSVFICRSSCLVHEKSN